MSCSNCLCPECDNMACSNYDARVCDIEEYKYFNVQNPSCLVAVCSGFKEKKGENENANH